MGHMVASVADSIMAGQLGTTALAAVSLSVAIYALFALFGIGLMAGLTPLVAKADGQKNESAKESLFKHGFVMSIIAGAILTLLMLSIIPFLGDIGQNAAVIKEAIPYYMTLATSIIFSLLFFHFKQFGEGIHLVKMTMWINIWGNILNVFLNFVLLKGWFGLPELGTFGIGLATLISRVIMLSALIIQCRNSSMRSYMDAYSKIKLELKKLKELVNDCLPIAFQYIIEMSAFTVGALMTGWFGEISLAAHQISINIVSITYLIAAGLGAATSVIVGNGYGEKNMEKIKMTARKSSILIIVFMTIITVLLIFGKRFFPSLYIDNTEVIDLAAKLLIVAAIFQLFDGLQVVALGVLRGINDLKTPTYIALISYWVITIPLCYYFGSVLHFETVGIWYAFVVGLLVSSLLLFLRIKHKFEQKLF